jgi:hypothetical protein
MDQLKIGTAHEANTGRTSRLGGSRPAGIAKALQPLMFYVQLEAPQQAIGRLLAFAMIPESWYNVPVECRTGYHYGRQPFRDSSLVPL